MLNELRRAVTASEDVWRVCILAISIPNPISNNVCARVDINLVIHFCLVICINRSVFVFSSLGRRFW